MWPSHDQRCVPMETPRTNCAVSQKPSEHFNSYIYVKRWRHMLTVTVTVSIAFRDVSIAYINLIIQITIQWAWQFKYPPKYHEQVAWAANVANLTSGCDPVKFTTACLHVTQIAWCLNGHFFANIPVVSFQLNLPLCIWVHYVHFMFVASGCTFKLLARNESIDLSPFLSSQMRHHLGRWTCANRYKPAKLVCYESQTRIYGHRVTWGAYQCNSQV